MPVAKIIRFTKISFASFLIEDEFFFQYFDIKFYFFISNYTLKKNNLVNFH